MTTLLEAAQEMDFAVCELSPALQELVQVVGLAAALGLAEQYGGITLHIPDNCELPLSRKASELVGMIGQEAAQKLIQYCAGDKLYIPKGDRALRCMRDRLMVQEYDAGHTTVARLARKHRLSERQARTILNKIPQPSKQLSFDFG